MEDKEKWNKVMTNITTTRNIPSEITADTIAEFCLFCFQNGVTGLETAHFVLSSREELLIAFRENEENMQNVLNLFDSTVNLYMSKTLQNSHQVQLVVNMTWMCGAYKNAVIYKIAPKSFENTVDDLCSFIIAGNKKEDASILSDVLMNLYTSVVVQNKYDDAFLQKVLSKFGVLDDYAETDDVIFYTYQARLALILFTIINEQNYWRYRGKVQQLYVGFFGYVLKHIDILKEVSFKDSVQPICLDGASLPLFIQVLDDFAKNANAEYKSVFNEFCTWLQYFVMNKTIPQELFAKLIDSRLFVLISCEKYAEILMKTTSVAHYAALLKDNLVLRTTIFQEVAKTDAKYVNEPFFGLVLFYLKSSTDSGLFEYLAFIRGAFKVDRQIALKQMKNLMDAVFVSDTPPIVQIDFYESIISLIDIMDEEEGLSVVFDILRNTWKVQENKRVFSRFVSKFTEKLVEKKGMSVFIIHEMVASLYGTNDLKTLFNCAQPIRFPILLPVLLELVFKQICPLDLYVNIQTIFLTHDINLHYLSKYGLGMMVHLLSKIENALILEQLQNFVEMAILYNAPPYLGCELLDILENEKHKNVVMKMINKLLSTEKKKPQKTLYLMGEPLIYAKTMNLSYKSQTIAFCVNRSEFNELQYIFDFYVDQHSLAVIYKDAHFEIVLNEDTKTELHIPIDCTIQSKTWYFVFLHFEQKIGGQSVHVQISNEANPVTCLYDMTIPYKHKDTTLSTTKNFIGSSHKYKNGFMGQMLFLSVYSSCLIPLEVFTMQTKMFDVSDQPQQLKRILFVSPFNVVKETKKALMFMKADKVPQTIDGDKIVVGKIQNLFQALHQANFFFHFFAFVRKLNKQEHMEVFKSNARANNPLFFLVSFITRCVSGSDDLKDDFIKMKGVILLRSIIIKAVPIQVIPAVFDQIQRLSEAFIEDSNYGQFKEMLSDFRIWISFSATLQKYVLAKVIVMLKDTPEYMEYLSNLMILFYQPQFPNGLRIHGWSQRRINNTDVKEIREIIWNALSESITPTKSSLQSFITTLYSVSSDELFYEGVTLLLNRIDFSVRWVELFTSYLCNELLCLLTRGGFKVKELILEVVVKFLQSIDMKYYTLGFDIAKAVVGSISQETIFTLEEMNLLNKIPQRIADIMQVKVMIFRLFQYSTAEVSEKLISQWISTNEVLPIVNERDKDINYNIVEGLLGGIKGDIKKFGPICSLIRRGLNNDVLRNVENIARLFVLHLKIEEGFTEVTMIPDLFFLISKALEEKKTEKAIQTFVACVNLFLTKVLQRGGNRVFSIEALIPFFEGLRMDFGVESALRKLRIIRSMQEAENTTSEPVIVDNQREVIALYGVFCMDRILMSTNADIRGRLLKTLFNISKTFSEELLTETKNYSNATDDEKMVMEEFLRTGKYSDMEGLVAGVMFSKVRRVLSGFASDLIYKEEEYRSNSSKEVNSLSDKKKLKVARYSYCDFVFGEIHVAENLERIDELKSKLNQELILMENEWDIFDQNVSLMKDNTNTLGEAAGDNGNDDQKRVESLLLSHL
ncbi:hypothetical protein EIN_222280 [Entamoeba invadens IP1]|uniref:Uncharacterized protein n=1 Tax=Entamoeba invadens IP1 TaxID=370355 RepID=A0A0A1U5G9_ENTIV|nr:hypothetical protein EIN_222280 [Entamoeba invadens IP1]ELP88085.1 hypothetical protein EIN_222280 [Entamoeba invadens IP1]|eukprot:XP_004254856.1 hypothetical protein EIN_222280 [Entamoeba invadens IP1]